MRTLLLLIASFFSIELLFAQSFTVYNYSVPEGLPSSETYEVFQDSKGFLWFATDNGVVRFDGQEIEHFHVKEGLNDPVVFGFFEDSKGKIWFRTYSGRLAFYDNGKITRYDKCKELDDFKYRIPYTIYHGDDSVTWVTGKQFFAKIYPDGKLEYRSLPAETLIIESMGKSFLTASNTLYKGLQNVLIDGRNFHLPG